MLLMLSAAPVLWEVNSDLKFRDLIVEVSRLVLWPKYSSTVTHHRASGDGESAGLIRSMSVHQELSECA